MTRPWARIPAGARGNTRCHPIGRALANPITRRSFTDFVKKTLETAGYEARPEGAQQIVQDFDAT